MVWCTKCWTIVSGGFGYTNDRGDIKFNCMDCTEEESQKYKRYQKLKDAQDKQKEKV